MSSKHMLLRAQPTEIRVPALPALRRRPGACACQGEGPKERHGRGDGAESRLWRVPEPPGARGQRAATRGRWDRGCGAARRALPVQREPPSTAPRSPSLRRCQARPLAVAPLFPGTVARRGAGSLPSRPHGAPGASCGGQGSATRDPNLCPQPRSSPIARSFRLCTSSSPPALPLARRGPPRVQAPGCFILRPRGMHSNTDGLSLSTRLRHRRRGFPNCF